MRLAYNLCPFLKEQFKATTWLKQEVNDAKGQLDQAKGCFNYLRIHSYKVDGMMPKANLTFYYLIILAMK